MMLELHLEDSRSAANCLVEEGLPRQEVQHVKSSGNGEGMALSELQVVQCGRVRGGMG